MPSHRNHMRFIMPHKYEGEFNYRAQRAFLGTFSTEPFNSQFDIMKQIANG